MVTVPALTGVLLAPTWRQIPLLLTWWFGYFTFFAVSVWFRGRYKRRDLPPVVVYGAGTVVMGVITLVLSFHLLWWALPFAPLVAVAVWETYRRRPRSLLSGESTVVAACLMTPVMVTSAGWEHLGAGAWSAFAVYLAFYAGSVPYVKTLIRERTSIPWFWGSVGYHVVAVWAAVGAVQFGGVHWLCIPVAVWLLVRAYGMPSLAKHRGTPWRPKQVGKLEMLYSVFVIAAALLSAFSF